MAKYLPCDALRIASSLPKQPYVVWVLVFTHGSTGRRRKRSTTGLFLSISAITTGPMHTYTSWLYLYGGFQVPNCDMQTNLVCKIILLLQVMNTTILLLVLFCNYLFSLGLVCPSAASGASASSGSSNAIANGSNAFALLSFKAMLHDPAGLLESWNTSNHLCSWYGVRCGGYRHGELRVVVLELNSCGLAGRISPSLGNLSFLSMLDLGSNQLQGQIPRELSNLGRLQVLNLTGNDLNGHIPAALGGCLELRKMALGRNQLQGEIPPQILQSMRKLTVLDVRYNSLSGEIPLSSSSIMMNLSLSLTHLLLDNNMLSGEIPSALGNLSTLRVLSLENNLLSGGIPSSLGRLSISQLSLGFNNFSGNLPPSIWNMSSLTKLEAFGNKLTGEIPQDAFNTLSHLELLHIYDNMFYGPVPTSLENSSNLAHIDFHKNLLTGTIPPIFGGMKNLQCLMLFSNHLKAEQPEDWKFMSTLSNCSSLQYLQIGDNKFRGEFPTSVSNLPTSIRKFFMRETEISGSIPAGIGNLVNLEALDLENGKLIGSLPSTFGLLKNLQGLFLSGNKLTGKIPRTLGNLTRMNKLYLASNNFTGNIPTSLGNMKSLEALNLSHKQLTGTIPKELASILTLSGEFDLSHNHLEGSIPFEFGNLQNLVEFNAESNRLSGEIPASFGDCRVLQFLYLQNNLLQGSIPQLSSGLKGLQRLDLSNNNLSGQIPKFLQDSRSISYLNLSFNHLVGDVPVVGIFSNASAISIQGNRYLCGGIHELHLPPCSFPSKSKYLVKVVVSLVMTVCVFVLMLLICALYKRKSAKSPMKSSSFRGHMMITYADLVKATDGFAIANLIGAGSHGSVFKATLGDDSGNFANHVAVKVLNLQTQGAAKSFTKECEAIRNLRHRNLVKIISVCSSIDFRGNDFKAIVLDFMPNGSLEDWLHPQGNNGTNPRLLSLTQRVNIAFDVASALDYLHHYSVTPVIHCDLKPSNVLLDEDMVAHLGDFGIAQIITEDSSCKTNSTSSLGLKGTVGYSAPEYGAGNRVSANGDIYSFGVVLLEMMTGKRPTDFVFNNGLSLHKLVEMALPDGVMDIVDKNMAADQDGNGALHCSWIASEPKKWEIECITCLLKLGLVCCEELPSSRLSAKEIIKELGVIRESLTAQNT